MRLTTLKTLCLAACLLSPAVARPEGPPAPRPDGTVDLQGFIQGRLEEGAKKVVVPPGRYRVAPHDKVHLRLCNLEDVEIVMRGVEMVCTETTRAVSIAHCRNVSISGLTIDYDPLPFTQGRITALGPEKEWLEFELIAGFPEHTLEQRIAILDAESGELKVRTRYDWQPFEKIGDRRYRLRRGPRYRYDPGAISEAIGDHLVTNSVFAPGGRIPHAVVIDDSAAVTLADVAVYSSPSFAFVEHHCDAITYLRCRLERRAPADDPVHRECRRLRSGNADGFHSLNATRGPQIIACHASHMDDDGVNIHGTYTMVVAAEGRTIRLLGDRKPDLRKGDVLELITHDGVRLADGVVEGEPEPDGVSTADIGAFFARQSLIGRIKESLSRPECAVWKIAVRDPVSLPMGSVVGATNRMGSGFAVKDSFFGHNRSRGILIKASQGVVSGNTCRDNWGPAILISPEWYWLEAGSSDDLVVSGNTISGCRDTSIKIHALAGSGKPAPAGAHARITVLDNTITTDRLPAIHVSSLKDGSIRGNTITASSRDESGDAPDPGSPERKRRDVRNGHSQSSEGVAGEAISLDHNENVDVGDNAIHPRGTEKLGHP